VTYGRTDGHTDILPRPSPRYAYALRGKNWYHKPAQNTARPIRYYKSVAENLFDIKLHVRSVRNRYRYWFSGSGFWRRLLKCKRVIGMKHDQKTTSKNRRQTSVDDVWYVQGAWSMTRKRRRKTGARRVLTMSDTYKADMISYRIEQNSSYEKNSAGVGFRR